jgi:hypothetical protein
MNLVLPALRRLLAPLLVAARDLAPVVIVIIVFQSLILKQPIPDLGGMAVGLVFVLLGLALFVRGLELGLFPIGEALAFAFAERSNLILLLVFSFLLGFGTTVAEPALIAIARKAAVVAANGHVIANTDAAIRSYADGLRLTVAFSVGLAVVLGVMRIILGWPLHWCMAAGYTAVVVMTWFAPPEIIGIAFDSGGVTTSTVTVPLLASLGVGLAMAIRERNPLLDGFGLIAFASLLPIPFVMLYGMVTG